MSIQSTSRSIYILTIRLAVVFFSMPALAQSTAAPADSLSVAKVKKKDSAGHQLCLGVDIFHPATNLYYNDRKAYEFEADYYLRNEYYGTLETGWGASNVHYTDLKYTTSNNFLRLGFNKTILQRDNPRDWDMMLFGLRMGLADISRSGATYMVTDSVWGNTKDSSVARKPPFIAVWLELTAGMRVEVVRGLFAGWNVRGKFMMNGKSFNDLSPLYIAGYGKGDKNSAFDFNLYISYAIRWKRND